MEIIFKNKSVEKYCTNIKVANKQFGKIVSDKLFMTLQFIENAVNLLDVKKMPQYHLHDLKGNRKGLYSIYLGKTGYRIVITPLDDNYKNLVNDAEGSLFVKAVKVEIEEVCNHYGD